MIQWIITIGILLLVLAYTIQKIVRIIQRSGDKSASSCASCASDCSSCPFLAKINLPDNLEKKH